MDEIALRRAVTRNVILLAASFAALYGMGQLVLAVAAATFALATGVHSLAGLGPAIFLATGALAALPAGRAMDRHGRVPVLAGGFLMGIAGTLLTGAGAAWPSAWLVAAGFVLIGAANATVLLARMAAAEMFPPARRARGIALVLMGAIAGALLGPLVFMPLFAGKTMTLENLVIPWFAASGFMFAGLLLVSQVRPDTRRLGALIQAGGTNPANTPAPPATAATRCSTTPRVRTAMFTACVSAAIMVSMMALTGYIMAGHGHAPGAAFPAITAHFLGMFGLALVAGNLIDRLGRRPAMLGGLAIMAASVLAFIWAQSVWATALAMFGIGLGWNFSYVAATAELVDSAPAAARGRLLGTNDLIAGLLGAALVLLGGYLFEHAGLTTLSVTFTLLTLAPVYWIQRAAVTDTSADTKEQPCDPDS